MTKTWTVRCEEIHIVEYTVTAEDEEGAKAAVEGEKGHTVDASIEDYLSVELEE